VTPESKGSEQQMNIVTRLAVRIAGAAAVLAAGLGVAPEAAAQADADWSAYRKQVQEAPRDTIDAGAYSGWKQYELNCARCHGEYGVGTSFAPALVASLKDKGTVPDQAAFVSVVCQGRKEKGMPSWCELGLEMDKIMNMYAYLKLRADGKVHAGRPASKG
jgi:mono/diheme cytochrome c family protein